MANEPVGSVGSDPLDRPAPVWQEAPLYWPGDRVHVLCRNTGERPEVHTVGVSGLVSTMLASDGGPPRLHLTGVRVDDPLIVALEGPSIALKDVYADLRRAERDAVWQALDFSEEDWRESIGLPGGDPVASDLPPCCANISRIREILDGARSDGGIIARDAADVERQMAGHYVAEGTALARILYVTRRAAVEAP